MALTDDWTDDCDFDFGLTSASLSTFGSRHSSSASTRQTSSTAYVSAVESLDEIDEVDGFDDFRVDHARPLQFEAKLRKVIEGHSETMTGIESDWNKLGTPRSQTSSRASDLIRSGEVTATMLGGRAFVTRLGPTKHSSPAYRSKTQASHAEQREQVAENEDLDFPVKLELKSSKVMADEDEVDWGLDEDDERESTLKAGAATLKGFRPPKKLDTDTIRQGRKSLSSQSKYSEDDEESKSQEDSFDLPAGLSHIKLATATFQSDTASRHQSSRSSRTSTNDKAHLQNTGSTSTSGWDTPGSLLPSHSRRSGHSTSITSPSSSSNTSVTSLSMLGTDNSEVDDRGVLVADQEGEDMEDGLLLPNPTFFSSGRVQELNSLLDRKRKPQALPANHPPASAGNQRSSSGNSRTSSSDLTRPTIASASRSRAKDRREESFEDGLVFDDAGTELDPGRLNRLRTIRAGISRTSDAGRTIRGTGTGLQRTALNVSGSTRGFISLEEMARTATQAGNSAKSWSPAPVGTRVTSAFVAESSSGARARALESRSITNPSPSLASTLSLAAHTPNRLRHQKSYSRLQQPPPSPSMGRKQSLQSLQDAMANQSGNLGSRLGGECRRAVARSYEGQTAASVARALRRDRDQAAPPPALSTGSAGRMSSWSEQAAAIDRLTLPTSSSRAKARPAMSSIFAASSPPSALHRTLSPPVPAQVLRRPKKPRSYGDGTELDAFDDLRVDRQKESTMKVTDTRSKSRASDVATSVPERELPLSDLVLSLPNTDIAPLASQLHSLHLAFQMCNIALLSSATNVRSRRRPPVFQRPLSPTQDEHLLSFAN
jgi:hypothetical protein